MLRPPTETQRLAIFGFFGVARQFSGIESTLLGALNCFFIHYLRIPSGLFAQNVERSQKRFKDSSVVHMLHQERVVLGQEGKTLNFDFAFTHVAKE